MRIDPEALPRQEFWIGVGVLVVLVGSALEAHRRERDPAVAFAFAGALLLAGIPGARLLWVWTGLEGPVQGEAAWSSIWRIREGGFASFGGLFGATLAALAIGRFLEDRRWTGLLDVTVPAGLVGLAVARIGCISAGCDFGRRTALPWGLQYPAGSPAWQEHLARGWLDPAAAWSLPVHPFPFYLAVVIVVAVLAGSRVEAPGARAWTVATAYCLGRLVAEGFRSPSTDLRVAGEWLHLNQTWAAGSLVILGYLFWRRSGS